MKNSNKILKLLFFSSTLLFAQNTDLSNYHPFSNKILISAAFGFTHSYTDYLYPQPELLERGSIEYFFPSKTNSAFGLKLLGGISKITAYGNNYLDNNVSPNFKTDLFFLGTGFSYARKLGYTVPYLSMTISQLRFNPKDKNGNLLPNNFDRKYDLNASMYSLEVGVRFIVNSFWSVNLGINYNLTDSKYLDDIKFNGMNDKFISLFFGISLFHGGNNNLDSDGDGIKDNIDVCPSTPKGIKVNSIGCPVDSDFDSVPDYLDDCPHTPRNVLIDEHGCPEDSNKNGIADYLEVNLRNQKIKETETLKISKDLDEKPNFKVKRIDSTQIEKNKAENLEYKFKNEQMLNDLFFTDGNLFCFQIYAFKSLESALKVVKDLKKEGHKAFYVEAYPFNDDRIWYRVRIGYFKSLQEAKNYKLKYFQNR